MRDSAGRVTKIFEPDASGKLTVETDFEYDEAGKLTAIRQLGAAGEAARSRTLVYDANGQLTSIKQGEVAYFGATRYASGDDLLTANLSGGLTLRKDYDASGRLSELAILKGEQVLFGHRYHYNAYGSVDRLEDLAGVQTVDLSYDQLNRVSSFTDSVGVSRTYQYDAFGNLKDEAAADGNDSVDKHNRLHSSAGLTYDDAGEMTFDGAHSYTYNAENLIASVDGGKVRYVYNALGDLIERMSPKGTEKFIWLSGKLLAKQETDGTWTDFLYLDGQRALLLSTRPCRRSRILNRRMK